ADADLLERRLLAERDGGHDHAWSADAALGAALFDEGALQRVAAAEPFDRRHACAVDVREWHQAGVDRRAVDEHRARAALPFSAPFLRAGEPAVLAQDVEQPLQGVRVEPPTGAVQREAHAISFSGVAGIARRS